MTRPFTPVQGKISLKHKPISSNVGFNLFVCDRGLYTRFSVRWFAPERVLRALGGGRKGLRAVRPNNGNDRLDLL